MKATKYLTPVAAAVAWLGVSAPALAIEQIDLGNGLKLDARVNLTYTLATRVKSQDAVLGAATGSNDGNNNFNKNALTANRIGAFFDGTLSKGDNGLVVSASAFYDDVYHKVNDNNPGSGQPNAGYNPNRVNHAPPFNEFTDRHFGRVGDAVTVPRARARLQIDVIVVAAPDQPVCGMRQSQLVAQR